MYSHLGLFAEAYDQETLGGQAGWGVQEHCLIGSGLEFTTGQHGGRSSLEDGVGDQQRWDGFGIGGFRSLGINRQNG
jgi:hypothetical protein